MSETTTTTTTTVSPDATTPSTPSSSFAYIKKAKLMLCDNNIATRCNALKGMYILCDERDIISYMFKHRYDILIVRELEGTASSSEEKLLALHLIEKIIDVAPELVSKDIANSLAAVGSYKKDECRIQALATLRKLTLKNPDVVSKTFGFITLSNAVLDKECKNLKASIILTMLQLADSPKIRNVFPYRNIIMHMYAPLLQIDAPNAEETLKNWENAAHNVEIMLRTYSGIYLLTSNVTNGLSAIVNLLCQPVDVKLKHIILKLLSRVISFHTTKIKSSYKNGKKDNYNGSNELRNNKSSSSFFLDDSDDDDFSMPSNLDNVDKQMKKNKNNAGDDEMNEILQQYWTRDVNDLRGKNMLDTYHGVLLLAFFHVGLVPVLLDVASSFDNEDVSILANSVLATYINCSEQILSRNQNKQIISMTSMIQRMQQMNSNNNNNNNMISNIDSMNIQNMRSMSLLKSLSYKTGLGIYRSQIINTHYMMNMNTFFNLANNIRISNRSVDPAFKLIGETQRQDCLCVQTTNGVLTPGDHKQIGYYIKQKKNMAKSYSTVEDQLKKSRVIQTKEVFDWSWLDVAGLFDGSLQNQKHLKTTMRSHGKFIKRVAGFYRVTGDSKAYFARLNWAQEHMPYVSILTKLMGLLMESDHGIEFIEDDRRGKILMQIVAELTALTENKPLASRESNASNSSRGGSSRVIARHSEKLPEFFFSRYNINKTMVREYFTLIGFLSSTMKGEQKLTETGLFKIGTILAMNSKFDYISRLLISNIDITRVGTPAQNAYVDNILGNALMKPSVVSTDLMVHTLYVIGWSLLSRAANSSIWGMEKLHQMLESPFTECVKVSLDILNRVLKISADDSNLKMFIELLENNKHVQNDKEKAKKYFELFSENNLLCKILSLESGFKYAKSVGWLDFILLKYKEIPAIHNDSFVFDREIDMFNSFMPDDVLNAAQPPDIESLLEETAKENSSDSFGSRLSFDKKNKERPTPFEFTGPWTQKDGDRGYASKTLNWFTRLPWHINTVVTDKHGQVNIDSDSTYNCKNGYLSSLSHDNGNFLVIESIFLDEYGNRTSIEVKESKSISVNLRIGLYEIDNDGFLHLNSNASRNIHSISAGNGNNSSGGGNNNDSPNGNSNNNNTTGMVRNTRSSFTSIEDMPMIAQIKESRRNLMGGRPSSPSTAKNRLRSQSSSLDDDSFGEDDEGYVETMETLSLSTLEKHLEQLKLSEDILAEYESCRNIQIDHNHGQWYLSYVAEDRMWHLTGISFYVSLKPGLDLHVAFPTHIIEGLCRTGKGLEFLFDNIIDFETLCKNAFDQNVNLKNQRFALWTIGYMGCSDDGLEHLTNFNRRNAIKELLALATTSKYISVRSTCLYVIGLMSSFKGARTALRLNGWDMADQEYTSSCLPTNSKAYFNLNFSNSGEKNKTVNSDVTMEAEEEEKKLIEKKALLSSSPNFNLLYTSLIELTNPLSSKAALKKVKELRTKHPNLFSSPDMFLASYEILSTYRFQLHVRRYIHDIFKIGLENFSKLEKNGGIADGVKIEKIEEVEEDGGV